MVCGGHGWGDLWEPRHGETESSLRCDGQRSPSGSAVYLPGESGSVSAGGAGVWRGFHTGQAPRPARFELMDEVGTARIL